MSIIPIILSGGSGTRLWPLSTLEKPKQFLSLINKRTLIQETLLRLDKLSISTPIVSCNAAHRFLVAQQLSSICKEQPMILLEPAIRNTAPAIAAACYAALEKDKDAIVIVLPSDHVIQDNEAFCDALEIAIDQARKGFLVTFGVLPTFPSTGYGYVKNGCSLSKYVYHLEQFVEKPDIKKAHEYLISGQYSWNSGMFVFKAEIFLQELTQYDAEMARLTFEAFRNARLDKNFLWLEKESFSLIKSNSIDYAVMEKTKKGVIVKLNAGWSDIGSWSALYDISKKDKDMNVINGNVIVCDTKGSYFRTENIKKTIAVVGLDNIVIVDTDDVMLVAAKDKVENIKQVVEAVETTGKHDNACILYWS